MSLEAALGLGALVFFLSRSNKDDKNNKIDVLQMRDPQSFSNYTRDIIKIITTEPGVNPVGSQKFRGHRYPGDVDIFEKVIECCNLETALINIEKKIKDMIRNIDNRKDVFLGDFKAGLDDRYKVNYGNLNSKGKIFGWDIKKIRETLKKQYKKGLYNDEEMKILLEAAVENPSIHDWEIFNKLIRERFIQRWSNDELKKGKKIMNQDRKPKVLNLKDALTHDTIVKIDIWAPVDGRYTELTNFFLLIYLDENDKENVINTELSDRTESLLIDLAHYGQPELKKTLKYAKRLWALLSYSKGKKVEEILNKLYPLFSSDAGVLSQISAEIETIDLMLSSLRKMPFKKLINQIDGFKPRIGSLVQLDIDEKQIYETIDRIVKIAKREKYSESPSENAREDIRDLLENIDDILVEGIDQFAKDFLKERGLMNLDVEKILKSIN